MTELRYSLDEGAVAPTRAHPTDAGLDLRTPRAFLLPCHGHATVDTGVHVELPPGTCARVEPKSGLIDEGYTGSIRVKLYNLGRQGHYFDVGDAVAQLTVSPVLYPTPVEVDEVRGGPRGDAGLGSTGR